MNAMNFKKITLLIAFLLISVGEVLSLSLGQSVWDLKVNELKDLGVSIRAFKSDSMCDSTAHELWISIPEKFHKNKLVGVALTLFENEKLYLDINLIVESLEETLYSKTPFHGAVFVYLKVNGKMLL